MPFISAVLVAGGRAAEVATGGAVSSQTFTLICGIIMTVFVMLGGVKSTALADAVQGWFFILALWAIIFVTLKVVFNGSLIEAFQTVRVQTPDWFSYPGSDRRVHLSVARQLSARVRVRLHAAAAAGLCALGLLQRGPEGPASDGIPRALPPDHRLGRNDAHRSGRARGHAGPDQLGDRTGHPVYVQHHRGHARRAGADLDDRIPHRCAGGRSRPPRTRC